MSLVHKQSQFCAKSELDLFTVPPTQLSIDKSFTVSYQSSTPLKGSGPLEFQVDGCDDFTDLSQTMLYVNVQIVNSNGKQLDPTDIVAPTNLFLHSLFSKVELKLNGKQVCSMNNRIYPYRAMLETLLNYGSDAKSSHLECELYYKDTAGAMEDMKEDSKNVGFIDRLQYTLQDDGSIEMMGRLHHDMFQQEKLLLSKTDINVVLTRAANEFRLMSIKKKEYKVIFNDAQLLVQRVSASDKTSVGIEKALERGRAKYTVNKIQCKDITIPPGNRSITEDRLFNGKIPNRVIIVFVDNDAFHGSYSTNPYNFQHMNVSEIGLSINGQPLPYSEPLKLIFNDNGSGQYIRAYHALFSGIDKCLDRGNNISKTDYGKGYTIFTFNLSPDSDIGNHFSLLKTGSLRFSAHFSKAVSKTTQLLIFGEFDSVIELDRLRAVYSDED